MRELSLAFSVRLREAVLEVLHGGDVCDLAGVLWCEKCELVSKDEEKGLGRKATYVALRKIRKHRGQRSPLLGRGSRRTHEEESSHRGEKGHGDGRKPNGSTVDHELLDHGASRGGEGVRGWFVVFRGGVGLGCSRGGWRGSGSWGFELPWEAERSSRAGFVRV